jgi:hypothetical protein
MLVATVIGDIVGSRRHDSPSALHRQVHAALARTNELLKPTQRLEVTVGDEFQGCFATIADAVRASLLIRLLLVTDEQGADSRYGLGWGPVTVFDANRSPVSQDGPGWWAARDAIERAARLGKSPRTSFVRTCFSSAPESEAGPASCDASVEAFLLCRDAAVGHMTKRQRELLLGVMLGHSQDELAQLEGITQSAVSQTLARSGATAIELAHRRLELSEQ